VAYLANVIRMPDYQEPKTLDRAPIRQINHHNPLFVKKVYYAGM
jgi:hypothetical protein